MVSMGRIKPLAGDDQSHQTMADTAIPLVRVAVRLGREPIAQNHGGQATTFIGLYRKPNACVTI